MVFSAATIVAPNVPDKVDPIKYLTTAPQTKAQEQAQAQAQALAYAKLHGMSPEELERIIFGAEARKPKMNKSLSREEQQELQDAKTSTIPSKITPQADIPTSAVDYPYLFTNVRIRNAYQFLDASLVPSNPVVSRDSSLLAHTKAPTIKLSEYEFELGSEFLENIKDKVAEYGIVKLVLRDGRVIPPLPFAPDFTGFRTRKQVFLNEPTSFDYRQTKRGFFRALIRFHSTSTEKKRLQRLPTLERKPIDFYRLYHLVELHGGLDAVIKKKEWAQVGRELGYSSYALPTLSSTMRQMYARVLQPFKNWIAELIPTNLNPHLIPRLDVDDTGKSSWFKLPHGIIIDMESKTTDYSHRRIVNFEDAKHSPPYYTLKLFKQKQMDEIWRGPQELTVSELEQQYCQIPEWFQTERMHPQAKLVKYPIEAAKDNLREVWSQVRMDAWDFTSFSTRDSQEILEAIEGENIDDFLTADLDISGKFATSEWHKPQMGAYEVHGVVDGASRTWYTRHGVWIDQAAHEIVVVDPKAEVRNWSHGASAMATARVFLKSNWLSNLWQLDVDNTESIPICVQHVVYKIAHACAAGRPISPRVKDQALSILPLFLEYEQNVMTSLLQYLTEKNVEIVNSIVPEEFSYIVCRATKKRRFFSWMVINGEPYALDAFKHPGFATIINAKQKTATVKIVKKYGKEASPIFENLKTKISSGKTQNIGEWVAQLEHALESEQELPFQQDLQRLISTVPDEARQFAFCLGSAISKLRDWLKQSTNRKSEKSKPSEMVAQVECTDSSQEINVWAAKQREMVDQNADIWRNFENGIQNGFALPDSEQPYELPYMTINAAAELLRIPSQLSASHCQFLSEVSALVKWTQRVYDVAALPVSSRPFVTTFREELKQLRQEGMSLGVPSPAIPQRALSHMLDILKETEQLVGDVVTTNKALSPSNISEAYDAYVQNVSKIDVALSYSQEVAKLNSLYESIPLIERMSSQNFLDRPKRKEVLHLMFFEAIHGEIRALDSWLWQAKELDWVMIAKQLHRMAALEPPSPVPAAKVIPISSIGQVYSGLFNLKVVPDDVESVRSTFENTIQRLTQTPLATVVLYGFCP